MEKFYTAEDIMHILKIKRARAYNIIKELNRQLNNKGYETVPGRVSKMYFQERYCYKSERSEN